MPLTYASGELIKAGDRVRYYGEPGQIEFVVDSGSGDDALDWYLRELGPGAMVREPKVFGSVYVTDPDDGLLEFVSRQGEA